MDESKLDALYDHHSQRKYIQKIIDFFPKEIRSFLYKTLMKRLQKLIRDIYKNAETIQNVSMTQHLKLIEVHPYLGIFRGYVGSDCNLSCAFGFPNNPNYRVFFIINERGEDVGYVTGTKVFLPNGTTAFFINTINGLRVSGFTTEIIFSVFSKVREKLDVEEVVILGAQNEKTNLNYKSIKEIYRQYRGKHVPISFEDRSRQLREIIASQTKSKYEEDPKVFKRANYLNEPHIDIHVDVEERPFGISIPGKEIHRKDQLWITLKHAELAHQWQFSLDVSEIIGHLSLHQFAENTEKMPITVYKEKIEELFKALSIEEGEKIEFELLFFEGMLNAPDVFHKEHIEKTREILRRFKRARQFIGSELLLWTIAERHLKAAKHLIETMDVNVISASSNEVLVSSHWINHTALTLAIERGYIEIAKLLIDKGANINIQNREGHTALMLASIEGHIEIAKLLIDKGANINIQNREGHTALMLASIEGHTEIAKLLIDKGANINIQNREDHTALMLASIKSHTEIAKLLIDKGAGINIQNREGHTALMLATIEGHTEIVELLIDKRADIDIQNIEGHTALMLASIEGHTEIVELLIDKEADIDIQNEEGLTALMLASIEGHTEIVELLIDKEADIDIQNEEGYTALMLATIKDNTEIVMLLTDKEVKSESLSTIF